MTGGGASWATFSRWQVRLLGEDGEPAGGWKWEERLRDCRIDFEESGAATAQIKHDGDPYGVLGRVGERSVLRRVASW